MFLTSPDRLPQGGFARAFPAAILADPEAKRPLAIEHLSVDDTLVDTSDSINLRVCE